MEEKSIKNTMQTRKVTVSIFQYPTSYNPFSLLSYGDEELIWKESFLSDKDYSYLLELYTEKVEKYALCEEDFHYYRIVIRDNDRKAIRTLKR